MVDILRLLARWVGNTTEKTTTTETEKVKEEKEIEGEIVTEETGTEMKALRVVEACWKAVSRATSSLSTKRRDLASLIAPRHERNTVVTFSSIRR
jgi:hypothetical protein